MAEVLLLEGPHSPKPCSPLMASLIVPAMQAGGRRALEARGEDPKALGLRVVDHRVYVALDEPRWEAPMPEPEQMLGMLQGFPHRWSDHILPAVRAEHERLRGLFAPGASTERFAQDVEAVRDAWTNIWALHTETTGFAVGWFGLQAILSEGGIEDVDRVIGRLLSVEGNDIEALDARLHALGAAMDADAGLAPLLRSGDAERTVAALLATEGAIGEEFRALWAIVRHRIAGLDVYEPTWEEDPSPLQRALAAGPHRIATRDEREHARAARTKQREALAADIEARLPAPLRAPFRATLTAANAAWPLHETHHLHIDDVSLGLTRQALVRAGERLRDQGALKDPVEVVFLEADELSQALRTGRVESGVVERRRGEREAALAAVPRTVIGELTPAMRDNVFVTLLLGIRGATESGDPTVLGGTGASPGKVRGRARVVAWVEGLDDLAHGEILVAPATTPAWTVQMGRAKAYVTMHGGMLSHAAVIARELGLPAVTGVADVMRLVKTGDLVEVDGDAGTLTLLPDSEDSTE